MIILITAFEPFNKQTENASLDVLNSLHLILPGLTCIKVVLPVVYDNQIYGRLLDKHHPDIVLHMGEAGNRSKVNLEYRGINRMSAQVSDNQGIQKSEEAILPGGPSELIETIESSFIVENLKADGYPIELSQSAGAFICNLALYTSLYEVRQKRMATKVGFIHLPRLSHQDNPKDMPTISLAEAVETVQAIITYLVQKK